MEASGYGGVGAGARGGYEEKEGRFLFWFHFRRGSSLFECQSHTTACLHDGLKFLCVDLCPAEILDLAGNAKKKKKKATVSKGRIRVGGEGSLGTRGKTPQRRLDLGLHPEDGCLHQAINAHWAPEPG